MELRFIELMGLAWTEASSTKIAEGSAKAETIWLDLPIMGDMGMDRYRALG